MATQSVDVEDLIPAQVFAIAGGVALGIISLTAYGGTFDLGSTHSIAGVSMTLAFLLQAVSVVAVAWTNEMDLAFLKAWDSDVRGSRGKKYDDLSRWLALAMVALVVGIEFIPEVNNTVTGSDALATVVFLVEAAGIWAISWAA